MVWGQYIESQCWGYRQSSQCSFIAKASLSDQLWSKLRPSYWLGHVLCPHAKTSGILDELNGCGQSTLDPQAGNYTIKRILWAMIKTQGICCLLLVHLRHHWEMESPKVFSGAWWYLQVSFVSPSLLYSLVMKSLSPYHRKRATKLHTSLL